MSNGLIGLVESCKVQSEYNVTLKKQYRISPTETLSTDLSRSYIGDITKELYILVGAASGVGKTTYADDFFVWNAYEQQLSGSNISILYQSWEISKDMKMAKLASILIYRKYRVEVSINKILARSEEPLTENEYNLLQDVAPTVDKFFEDNYFDENPKTPEEFQTYLIQYAEANGNFSFKDGVIDSYTPEDPAKVHLIVIDHIALCQVSKGETLKSAIDKISKMCIRFRKLCKFTFIVIQQFSTSLASTNRSRQLDEFELSPTPLDFGDSSYTYRDADIVIGLVKPINFQLNYFFEHNVQELGEHLISAYLVKTRFGKSNKVINYYLNYKASTFLELPKSDVLRITSGGYSKYFNS